MFYICLKCPVGIRVVGDPVEIDNLVGVNSIHHGKYTCPICGSADIEVAPHVDGSVYRNRTIRDLTPHEAHLAFEGLGFPSERDCVYDIVSQELSTKRVVRVNGRTVHGTSRSVIDSLDLDDGTTIFLSGSAHGAIVYRIRKPNPYLDT